MATWDIHHTSLSVSDAEQSLRFYRDGLGLKLVGDSTERSQRLAEEVEVPGAYARCLWLETTEGHVLSYAISPTKVYILIGTISTSIRQISE